MKKILQCIFPNLVPPDISSKRVIDDLKANSSFGSKKELVDLNVVDLEHCLESGKFQSVFLPDLGGQNNLEVKKWYFQVGSIVKRGDVICDLANEIISMEFESFTQGKIVFQCETNIILNKDEVLFKIEGI